MALSKGKVSDIPSDAILLSRSEAIIHQANTMKEWRNIKDVWGYRYGPGILTLAAGATGFYLNSHYRLKLHLHQYGKLVTYLPSVMLPAVIAFLLHTQLVTVNLLLPDHCPTCMEIRAVSLQTTIGVFFPALLTPISSIPLAISYATYDIPRIQEPKKLFNLWKKITFPIKNILFAIFLGQAMLAAGITYLEAKSVDRVNRKMLIIEEAYFSS